MSESVGAFPIDVVAKQPDNRLDPFDPAELHRRNELAHQDRQAYLDRVLSYTGMEERLATPESRTEFVDQMTGEEFVRTLEWLNGIIRGVPTTQRHVGTEIHFSLVADTEQGKTTVAEVFPAPEDRIALLHNVLAAAQSVTSLEDKACILGLGIAGVHAFPDGTGRLARITYHLLTEGYTPGDEILHEILGINGRELIDTKPLDVDTVILQSIQLLSGTHKDLGGGQVAPLLRTVVTKEAFARSTEYLRLRGRGTVRDLDRVIFDLLINSEYATMLPYIAGKTEGNLATLRAMMTVGDEVYFALDRFWKKASTEDMALYYQLYRDISNMRLGLLLEEVMHGEKSHIVTIYDSSGEPIQKATAGDMLRATIRRKARVDTRSTPA